MARLVCKHWSCRNAFCTGKRISLPYSQHTSQQSLGIFVSQCSLGLRTHKLTRFQVYTAAGSPSQVRGLATNVANYNAWTIATAPSYTSGDPNYDEELYITALAPLLVSAGYPPHFITDTCKIPLPFPPSHPIQCPLLQKPTHSPPSQHATASSPQSKTPGVTGATSSALASVCVPPPIPAMRSKTPSSGLSRAESAMARAIQRARDMMPIVAILMPFSRLQRRELGSRRTLCSC